MTGNTSPINQGVGDFHKACGVEERETPGFVEPETFALRRRLLLEEVFEYVEASDAEDLIDIADALADIVYIAYGTARVIGVNLDDVLAEVQRSNMSKVGADGKVVRRDDGKILKPDTYSAPNIGKVMFP